MPPEIPRVNIDHLELVIKGAKDRKVKLSLGIPEKCLQLVVDNSPFLRFGPDYLLHKDLLIKFFNESKKAGNSLVTDEEIRDFVTTYPPIKTKTYELVGAGFADIYPLSNKIVFLGRSSGFKLPINIDHINKIREYLPGWDLS